MTRKMKDSGIEWIGEIPEDWKLTKVKHIGKYINGYPFKPSDWSDSGVPIIRIQNLTGNNSEYNYYSGPKLPEDYFIIKNDYLISWSATLGVFIWHKDKGYLNQHIFKAVPNEAVINYDYFYWIAKIFIEEIQSYMHGSAMQHVTKAVFDNFTIPLPSGKQEQIKISETLSSKIALKNSTKQSIIKEIQTLEDYKKSVITEAVTKGLDKNVETKDSGIEWIGEIPKHWEVVKIKYIPKKDDINSFIDGDWIESNYIKEDGIRYITTGNIGDGKFIVQGNGFISREDFEFLRCKYAYPGDLIFSRLNAPYGRSCLLPDNYSEYVIAVDNVILRPDEYYNRKFINYLTQCIGYQQSVKDSASGTTMQRISRTKLGNIPLPFPNTEEQNDIVDYLDKKTKLIDDSIAIKQKQLDTLEEYKKSLIYEYVTGKKEVKDGEET